MSVLSTLRKLKSAADFDAASDTLTTEHAAALAEVQALEAKRENELFKGRSLDKLERDLAAAQGKAATLGIAVTGAEKRRTAAVEAERMAALEKQGAAAHRLNDKLRDAMIGFAKAAETLAGHAGEIKAMRHKLRGAKAELVAGGCGDLAPRDPVNDAAAAAGRPVRDPLDSLHVAEFWPKHPDGAALLALTT